jgi:hypothetical protein
VTLPYVFANSERIASLTSRLSISHGASNTPAAAAAIATAAALPINMSARDSFMRLAASASSYRLVCFLEPREEETNASINVLLRML